MAATVLVAVPNAGARAPAVSAALKGADAPSAQLRTSATKTLPGGTVVNRFEQEVGGVPVVGAGAVVVDSPSGSPELLFDNSHANVDAPGSASVSRSQAVTAALGTIAGRITGEPTSRQVIVPRDGGTLAWEVGATTDAPADWVVRIDAATGSVIERFNQIRQAVGAAKLFVPNAVVANDGYNGLRDRKDHNYSALTKLREPVTLENLDDGQDCLKGDWVNVKRGAKHKKVCKGSLDWSKVKRQRNVFEALMAYFHIDETQQYIQSLGLDPINAESQNVVADSFTDDNSFYQPSADRIELGTGGVDDGEDADVIVHEYGHSVQDAQNEAAFTGQADPGAMGEGFGDYLSQAYSTEAVGFDSEWSRCVMEWDATSYDNNSNYPPGICLRRTDNPNSRLEQETEQACGGEVHCVGEVWGSALFELRQELGDDGSNRSIMDRVTLASHELLPPSPTFQQAVTALEKADEDLYPAGTPDDCQGDHYTEIAAEMSDRFAALNLCV